MNDNTGWWFFLGWLSAPQLVLAGRSLLFCISNGRRRMKHRKVETTSEYYNAIPTRFKLQAKVVLEQWAKDFVAPDNKLSFSDFIDQIVPHFYECWRIIINAQIAKNLFIAAIQKVEPTYNVETLA